MHVHHVGDGRRRPALAPRATERHRPAARLGRRAGTDGLGRPGLLTRALFNLLENAVKYSPAGTVVSLSIRLEGDWLSCRIVDQGKGIAAAELPRLFSQYQRFASAEGSAGLGLGLAMVKTVIDRHGGRIGCQSQVGQGTTFEIRLPLLKGEE